MFKKNIFLVILIFTIGSFLLLFGCGKRKYGKKIPSNFKVVKLKEIMENPEKYKDREVVLEGNFGGICCADDFNYKEGLEVVEVYPKGFSNPKLNKGIHIRIYGVVRTIEKKSGIEKGGEQKKAYEVFIEAKGVEVK